MYNPFYWLQFEAHSFKHYLKKKKTETQKEREKQKRGLSDTGFLPNACKNQGIARSKPRAQTLIYKLRCGWQETEYLGHHLPPSMCTCRTWSQALPCGMWASQATAYADRAQHSLLIQDLKNHDSIKFTWNTQNLGFSPKNEKKFVVTMLICLWRV